MLIYLAMKNIFRLILSFKNIIQAFYDKGLKPSSTHFSEWQIIIWSHLWISINRRVKSQFISKQESGMANA